jgi:hypothetical protein
MLAPRDEDGWFISSFSNPGGSCVEVRFAERGSILVRDSKDRRFSYSSLDLTSGGWAAFLRTVTDVS